MVFIRCVMIFTFLLVTCTAQSSQQSDDDFDIEAQYLACDHQDYVKKCALRNFVASADIQQLIQNHRQEQSAVYLVEQAEQDRTALWQVVMNDVLQERKLQQKNKKNKDVMWQKIAYNELQERKQKQAVDTYLKNKEKTKLILAQQGLFLEGDSNDEFDIGVKDLEIIEDPMFTKKFQKLFDDNIFKLHTSLPRDVVEDKNRYFTLVAYQSFAEMNINKEAHKALWNAVKIKSCSSLVKKTIVNQYEIVAPQKESPTSIVQIDEVKSSNKAITTQENKNVKKKKLTPAQQAKEDEEAKFLDEQIALRQEEARIAQINANDFVAKQLSQEQQALKVKQKAALKAKITSLRNKSDEDQVFCQSVGTACSCCQGMMREIGSDDDSDDEDFQGGYSVCRQRVRKIDNHHYSVSTTVSEDLFITFYQENPELIALVDSYKNKGANALQQDLGFEYFVNKFLLFMNIPARQRIAMKAAMKSTAALLWRDAHRKLYTK